MGLLLLLLIAVPIVELLVIVQVAQWIGILETIVLLFGVSIAGAYLVKHEGIAVIRRIIQDRREGHVPAAAAFDAALIALAGILLVVPGFVTDIIGLLLLLPPVRSGVKSWLRHRWVPRTVTRGLDR